MHVYVYNGYVLSSCMRMYQRVRTMQAPCWSVAISPIPRFIPPAPPLLPLPITTRFRAKSLFVYRLIHGPIPGGRGDKY